VRSDRAPRFTTGAPFAQRRSVKQTGRAQCTQLRAVQVPARGWPGSADGAGAATNRACAQWRAISNANAPAYRDRTTSSCATVAAFRPRRSISSTSPARSYSPARTARTTAIRSASSTLPGAPPSFGPTRVAICTFGSQSTRPFRSITAPFPPITVPSSFSTPALSAESSHFIGVLCFRYRH